MARLARVVVPGIAHHVTQRGNHKEAVFFNEEDRRVYLASLTENSLRYGVRLLGFCLMTNHVHMIAIPEREDSLAKTFGRTHVDYARWQHIRQRQSGHLWQNRFFSCPLDAGHCWTALRYVELNPVRAQMAPNAWDWPWSSARAHVDAADSDIPLDLESWRACWSPPKWRETLEQDVEEAAFRARLRQATLTGRPLGSAGFARAMEAAVNRPLGPRKRGRKPLNQT